MSAEKIKLTELQVGYVMLYTVGILIASLMLGTKIDRPDSFQILHPTILILIIVWCTIGVTYMGAMHAVRNWILQMSIEAHEEQEQEHVRVPPSPEPQGRITRPDGTSCRQPFLRDRGID